jgi:ectoine hydroxylase-related dioxygenase (phytanoyl-CoA dioxygenase family)
MTTVAQFRKLQLQFEDQGYVILPALIEPQVQAAVRCEMEAIVDFLADHLMSQGRVTDPLKGEPFETRFYDLFKNHLDLAPKNLRFYLHRPGLYGLFFHAPLLDIVEQLLGPEIRLYPNYSVRPKLPEWSGTQVLWHQDAGYTSGDDAVAGLRMVNVWTPLVKTTAENGCMQFIPGTHKLGVVRHQQREHYIEIAEEFLNPRLSQAIDVELEPGDVVLFNNLLFHAGLPNRSKIVRWSLDWRYQDATQDTMRRERGHMARSRTSPQSVVASSRQWAQLWLS